MDKIFVLVTIGFPFKKSCLAEAEADASPSNNRGTHTIDCWWKRHLGVEVGRDGDCGTTESTEMSVSCPSKIS